MCYASYMHEENEIGFKVEISQLDAQTDSCNLQSVYLDLAVWSVVEAFCSCTRRQSKKMVENVIYVLKLTAVLLITI